MLEAIVTTLVIDACKERDVATFDVPGAYLYTFLPDNKNILMVLRNAFVDIMCEVNPDYKKHVIHLMNVMTYYYISSTLCQQLLGHTGSQDQIMYMPLI